MPIYAYGKKLKDANGNYVLPVTRSHLVYMSNNETVEDILGPFIPPVEHDIDLTDELIADNYIHGWVLSRGVWSDSYSNDQFFTSSENLNILIKLDHTKSYNITKIKADISLRTGLTPLMTVATKSFNKWPVTDLGSLRIVKIHYEEKPSYGSILIDIDNTNVPDNCCICVQLHLDGTETGSIRITTFGDKPGELPAVRQSNFYMQGCNDALINGKPNPLKNGTLEKYLMKFNMQLSKLENKQ